MHKLLFACVQQFGQCTVLTFWTSVGAKAIGDFASTNTHRGSAMMRLTMKPASSGTPNKMPAHGVIHGVWVRTDVQQRQQHVLWCELWPGHQSSQRFGGGRKITGTGELTVVMIMPSAEQRDTQLTEKSHVRIHG